MRKQSKWKERDPSLSGRPIWATKEDRLAVEQSERAREQHLRKQPFIDFTFGLFDMSATPTAVKQQPPSPPQSDDGDFDLSAVQQHIAALDRQALSPHIESTGLVEQVIVSAKTF